MLALALTLTLLPAAPVQVPDTLETVEAMLDGDALRGAVQVERWVAGLPPVDSGSGARPSEEGVAAFEKWDKDWEALMDVQDFEVEIARVMAEGLVVERTYPGVAWPALQERKTRLRREGSQMLVMALLRLELLERSAPELQAKQALEWLRTSRSGRGKQLEQLFELERTHVERLGAIRPAGGSVGDAIRNQRHLLKQAIDDRIGEAMQRGFDNRLQEAVAVRWLAGHANAERHDVLVEATSEVEEESWSKAPLYFDACLALGTQDAVEQCVATFRRIEALRKDLERSRGQGSKLVKKRAPRDWSLSKDDWTTLREAVSEDHDRVVERRLARLDRYRLAAEQRLATFAERLDAEAPEPGGERPYTSWKRWWSASRAALPGALDRAARGGGVVR
ncbi:MAG: hypothetical protein AAGB93_01650 [Planctomycetota bacterium]